ncbi:putative cytochrome P450 YjiB [Streptomyces humidus]|uniref:Cytochrome P450 YjiB n=1 Tax=Streptomyces humidus TaxID=52259 RepID=A0A918LBQ6_9ACTN|nr:cytochrome P450 [Streptomyces humidus]GGS29716.1 putative cytochrome P450 YjiB [Streptomyces humidus]
MAVVPMTEIDMFATSDRRTRCEQYRRLRELGGVVRLRDPDVYAVTRYDEVKAVLADHDAFVSGEGVGFDPEVNRLMRGVTLVSDPPEHDVLRCVVGAGLRPGTLRARGEEISRKARDLVGEVVAKGEIDGVTELAQALPMLIIPDYLGLPERNREHLYAWGQVGNDLLGPVSERTAHNMEMTGRLFAFAHELAANRELAPGSPGAAVLEAAGRGVVAEEKCPLLLVDLIGPSLETTAAAIGHLLVLFAERPGQWEALRAEPGLVASTVNELLRFETPVRGLTRVAACDVELGGVTVPQGARIWALFASANRDERKWERADEFDFRRNPLDHLGFGHGRHHCVGQGVARLELHAVVHALLDSVERIELAGDPVIAENTILNTYAEVPLRLVPSKAA